ncbi:hypothetical protein MMC18_004138 [Xylographa bjoerkii]|nr:hypothetical protein [Xylographa bjoerkii]
MAAPQPKRKRADTAGVAQPAPTANKHLQAILSLPDATIAGLLLHAAGQHPDVAANIAAAVERVTAQNDAHAESARVIDFDHYSKTAWRAINLQYKSMKGSYQYNASCGVQDDVVGCIEDIRKQCPAGVSYGTKKSALETLRKIGKTVCLSGGDVIGHEVQKGFHMETCLEDTMGTLGGRMEELVELSKGHCVFETLDEVVALLEGTKGEPRTSEDSDDDEEGSENESEE